MAGLPNENGDLGVRVESRDQIQVSSAKHLVFPKRRSLHPEQLSFTRSLRHGCPTWKAISLRSKRKIQSTPS